MAQGGCQGRAGLAIPDGFGCNRSSAAEQVALTTPEALARLPGFLFSFSIVQPACRVKIESRLRRDGMRDDDLHLEEPKQMDWNQPCHSEGVVFSMVNSASGDIFVAAAIL